MSIRSPMAFAGVLHRVIAPSCRGPPILKTVPRLLPPAACNRDPRVIDYRESPIRAGDRKSSITYRWTVGRSAYHMVTVRLRHCGLPRNRSQTRIDIEISPEPHTQSLGQQRPTMEFPEFKYRPRIPRLFGSVTCTRSKIEYRMEDTDVSVE